MALTPEQIEFCENVVCSYTNNDFIKRFSKLECKSVGGLLGANNEFININDRIIIFKSGNFDENNNLILDDRNFGRYNVIAVGENVMQLDKQIYNCDYNRVYKVVYPLDVLAGFEKLINYKDKRVDGVASETISRHSKTYEARTKDNTFMGYPLTLLGFCEPYMRARF